MLSEVARLPIERRAAEDAVALDALFSHSSQDFDNPSVYQAGLSYDYLAISG